MGFKIELAIHLSKD